MATGNRQIDNIGIAAPYQPVIGDDTVNSSFDRSGVFSFIRLLVIVLLPFIVIDAAFYQLQMFVLDGNTPISAVFLKFALLFLLSGAFLFRGSIDNPRLVKIGLILLSYLILDALFLYFVMNVDFIDILVSYNAYYALYFVTILAFALPLRISDRLIITIIIICFLGCAVLAFAQYITQQPIVPTTSSNGDFKVLAWEGDGKMRAFSLFIAPGFFGIFSAFIATLAIAFCKKKRNIAGAVVLFILAVGACWVSSTRTDMLALACSLFTALVITKSWGRGWGKWLPLIYIPVGLMVGFYAYYLSSSGGMNSSVTDTTSFTARLYEWQYYLGRFNANEWAKALFGYGLVQNSKSVTNGVSIPIDSFYLGVTLHIGIIGMIIIAGITWYLWLYLYKAASRNKSYLGIAVAASFSSIWCMGIFTLALIQQVGLILLFAVSAGAVSSRIDEAGTALE